MLAMRIDRDDISDKSPVWRRPVVIAAGAWIGGILLGATWPVFWTWLAVSAVAAMAGVALFHVKHMKRAAACSLIALLAAGAMWYVGREHRVPRDSIVQYLGDSSQLIEVVGTVESLPRIIETDRGPMADFSYRSPGTMFELTLHSITTDRGERSCSGRVLVRIDEADGRLRGGDRIIARGWLSKFQPPLNPGEPDYREIMRDRGMDGRLTLRTRGNWELLESNTLGLWFDLRQQTAERARASLRLGLDRDATRASFLEAILLGQRHGDIEELTDSFRQTGLAHILSISGAHLAILLGLVWWTVRFFVAKPSRVGMIVLAFLILYLAAVPWRTPIIRAGIMAALFAGGMLTGRRPAGIDLLAIAACIVLLWSPRDLFTPGFQLSFGAVAGLLLFTNKLSERFVPRPVDHPQVLQWTLTQRISYIVQRRIADYFAVSIVAFAVVFPLVAYHFQMITPLAIVLSVLALPFIVAVLGLGYLKIMIGLFIPSAGMMLAAPVEHAADGMIALVSAVAQWEAATIELPRPPSALWVLAAMALAFAWLAGMYRTRRLALAGATLLCIVWLGATSYPAISARIDGSNTAPIAMRVHMFAVGDGSCFVVELKSDDQQYNIMFDCGSQMYFDVGEASIVPAMRHAGIEKIDALFLSHADIDHFSGVIDIMNEVPVHRVYVPPQLLANASSNGGRATAYLIEHLQDRKIPIEVAFDGWNNKQAGGYLELIWPPPGYSPDRENDASMVLGIESAGRRILLCGDIQAEAMAAILQRGTNVAADICDLPHHGSYVDAAPQWMDAVDPSIVLQSSGPGRLHNDRWSTYFDGNQRQRLISEIDGKVQIDIDAHGGMTIKTFREDE